MKREELKELGLDGDIIDKVMALHGRDTEASKAELAKLTEESKAELAKLTEERDAVKAELDAHKETVKKLEEAGANAEAVKAELETLKKKVAEDAEKAQQAKSFDDFRETVESVLGERKFINGYTADSITRELYAMRQDPKNTSKGVKDLLDELTKDKPDVFKNPNTPPDMAGMGNPASPDDDGVSEEVMRQVMGLPPKK